jgi:indolepyruvate ferredoxin oxidoreductase alpha subunit
MIKKLLLGDEAIALGALHAGLKGVYAYPGTPSTEITEYIQQSPLAAERGVHRTWCTNEKTAMEAALGVSYAGCRALVCMKHVGLNVAADAFVNSAITGVNGGVIVLVADDPSMHSSQNEQDSRFYGKFAMMPILEPSTQQEAYNMMAYGYELSEREKVPVLMRVVTRLAHSRADVEVADEAQPLHQLPVDKNPAQWVLLPANARRNYISLIQKQVELQDASQNSPFKAYHTASESVAKGIIAAGIGYNYVMDCKEAAGKYNVLKVSQYPLPEEAIKTLAAKSTEILVVEDGMPFIEENVKAILSADVVVKGRLTGDLPRTGELTPDSVAAAMGVQREPAYAASQVVVPRPPALCQGCGHRDVYTALNEVLKNYPNARVFADIGCYTLGALPPFRAIDSCVDMGASITMAKGASDCGVFPAVAVIGDSTFTHSGMTGLLDAVNDKAHITVVISDNLTTAMTGGQDSAGTNKFEAICLGLGVEPEHVRVVVPLPKNMESIEAVIREELEYPGVSVIIPRRECIQTAARHAKQRKAAQEKANQLANNQ